MKPEYREGPKARKKSEEAMTAIFEVSKEEVPRAVCPRFAPLLGQPGVTALGKLFALL